MAWSRSPTSRTSAAAAAALALALSACGGGGDDPPPPPRDTTPPSVPEGLGLSLPEPNTIGLAWNPSTDAGGVAGYAVYRDGDFLTSVAGPSASDAGLPSMTRFCYQVSAFDEAGNVSFPGAPSCLTTGDGIDPSPPADVEVVASVSGSLHVSWTAASDDVAVEGYAVYLDGALVTSVAGTSAVVTDLSAVRQYCLTVSAFDASANESARSAPACATTLWSVATISCGLGGAVAAGSVALDAEGAVHVAYSGWNMTLEYASNVTSTWVTELVMEGQQDAAAGVDLAVEADGTPHVSYHSASYYPPPVQTKDLKYATKAGGTWTVETLDSAGDVGDPSSIAIGPGNVVHISYHDRTNGRVKHATGPDPGWITTAVDAGGPPSTIAVAPDGGVHVVYRTTDAWGYRVLKHALVGSGAPAVSSIATLLVLNDAGRLAFDPAGRPVVAYGTGSYATLVDGSWTFGGAATSMPVDELVVDALGKIHLYGVTSYFPPSHPDGLLALQHQTNASGAWTTTLSVIDVEPGAILLGLAVGTDGHVHAVYRDTAGACLRYAVDR